MKKMETMSQANDNPICRCEKRTVLKTSWSDDNSGRRFFGCSNYGKKFQNSCRFFQWYELPMSYREKSLLVGLLRKIRNNDRERRNVRIVWFVAIISSIVLTALFMEKI
ncbi:hypothetical protein GQ457_07G010940 [Hibiscus cannabinus]